MSVKSNTPQISTGQLKAQVKENHQHQTHSSPSNQGSERGDLHNSSPWVYRSLWSTAKTTLRYQPDLPRGSPAPVGTACRIKAEAARGTRGCGGKRGQ